MGCCCEVEPIQWEGAKLGRDEHVRNGREQRENRRRAEGQPQTNQQGDQRQQDSSRLETRRASAEFGISDNTSCCCSCYCSCCCREDYVLLYRSILDFSGSMYAVQLWGSKVMSGTV